MTPEQAIETLRGWSTNPDHIEAVRVLSDALAERDSEVKRLNRVADNLTLAGVVAEEQRDKLRAALETADKEASVAHDAIWSSEVAACGKLHDNDDPLSAQSAIWRLHEAARAVLGSVAPAKERAADPPRLSRRDFT